MFQSCFDSLQYHLLPTKISVSFLILLPTTWTCISYFPSSNLLTFLITNVPLPVMLYPFTSPSSTNLSFCLMRRDLLPSLVILYHDTGFLGLAYTLALTTPSKPTANLYNGWRSSMAAERKKQKPHMNKLGSTASYYTSQ